MERFGDVSVNAVMEPGSIQTTFDDGFGFAVSKACSGDMLSLDTAVVLRQIQAPECVPDKTETPQYVARKADAPYTERD